MSDDASAMHLPIRLVPRRSRAVGGALFALIWVFLLLSPVVGSMLLLVRQFDQLKENPVACLALLAPLLILVLGGWHVFFLLSRLLPHSPFDHVILDDNGVTWRRMRKHRIVTWAEIGRFAPFEEIRRNSKGLNKKTWLILAETQSTPPADDDGRIDRALLKFQAAPFGAAFISGKDTAELLAKWLNELLASKKSGEGIQRVHVPAPLTASARQESQESAHKQRDEPTLRPSRSSVIER